MRSPKSRGSHLKEEVTSTAVAVARQHHNAKLNYTAPQAAFSSTASMSRVSDNLRSRGEDIHRGCFDTGSLRIVVTPLSPYLLILLIPRPLLRLAVGSYRCCCAECIDVLNFKWLWPRARKIP